VAGRNFGPALGIIVFLAEVGGSKNDGPKNSADGSGLYDASKNEIKHRSRSSGPRITADYRRAPPMALCRRTPESMPPRSRNRTTRGPHSRARGKLARARVIDVSKLLGRSITFGATVDAGRRGHEKKTVWSRGETEDDAKKARYRSKSPPPVRYRQGQGQRVEVMDASGAKAYEIKGRMAMKRSQLIRPRTQGKSAARDRRRALSRHHASKRTRRSKL